MLSNCYFFLLLPPFCQKTALFLSAANFSCFLFASENPLNLKGERDVMFWSWMRQERWQVNFSFSYYILFSLLHIQSLKLFVKHSCLLLIAKKRFFFMYEEGFNFLYFCYIVNILLHFSKIAVKYIRETVSCKKN